MFTAITGGLNVISNLLSALSKWAGVFFAHQLGKKKVEAAVNLETVKILRKQLKLAAKPRPNRTKLLAAMAKRKVK